jgi:sulfoxide reductase heme-binding subunit YedZ
MSDLSATTPRRALRGRLLRHYAPLALGSVGALALFMNLSFFDANRYPPPAAIFEEGVEGAFPDGDSPAQDPSARTQHDGGTSQGQQHGGDPPSTAPPSETGGHSGPPPGGHSGPPPDESGGHSGPPAGGHSGPPPGDGDTSQPGPPTTQPDASGTADPSSQERHAGDQDNVLLMRRYSTATGYVATVLLGLTLLIGPANLILGRRNPISTYLRRDVGIWTAITSTVHVIFGFLVKHGDGQLLGYFFEPGDRSSVLTNSFGLANWAGLAGVLIVAGLAVISSDAALRKLKAKRWKRLQRFNYALFALVIVHALFYGALWRKTSPYTVLLGIAVIAVVAGQAIGVRLYRQRKAAAPAAAPAAG